jgi:hypothetical protein
LRTFLVHRDCAAIFVRWRSRRSTIASCWPIYGRSRSKRETSACCA